MWDIFWQASVIILVSVTLLWLLSVALRNASIVDIFWGFAYVIVNAFYFFKVASPEPRNYLLLALVSIWGLRLTLYLLWRNAGKGEDFRYQEFRRNYGVKRYWWVSFFQTFLLQGILVMLVSFPLLGVHFGNTKALNLIDYLALTIWMIGFVFEAGGDYQLARFKANPANKGKVLDTGVWRYTRHPNYFGDAAVWWAFALFSVAAGSYWQILGSIIMTLLLIKVSGVALLEKSLKDTKPQYREYIQKTPSFFPWFPRK